jgi:hypothetical protein
VARAGGISGVRRVSRVSAGVWGGAGGAKDSRPVDTCRAGVKVNPPLHFLHWSGEYR